ncbi:hypothetical protein KY310_01750 [Candidatus Woesearchaeota archaeon]|nr:hypothetical protein [Candidatus Woesearchaeota archaeon]
MDEEYDINKDPAYQLSKDEKGYRIRVDGRGWLFATKDDKIVHSSFIITDRNIFCTLKEGDDAVILVGNNPKTTHLEEVVGTQIQIYDNPRLKTRIGESLFYTTEQGKKEPLPLAVELRNLVRNRLAKKNGKSPSMDEILCAVNELRDGSLEEQAIYGLFRNHLIDNGFMPVDETGRPYDLSLMFIPEFDVNTVVDCPDAELKNFVLSYYQLNREDTEEMRSSDFIRCMNKMKVAAPQLFVQLHNYLAAEGHIPSKSPMLAELNLTAEQIDYLRHLKTPAVDAAVCHINNVISETLKAKTGKTLIFWDIRDQSSEWIAKYAQQINRTIATMRFGDVSDQQDYYDFCIAISEFQNTILAEKPSKPDRRRAMFERARQHSKAKLESRVKP